MHTEAAEPSPGILAQTPLHGLHLRHGAKMVGFAGYEMPLNYPAGLLREHLHTRAATGLFDVSHMGQIVLRSASGDFEHIARALETLVPVDVLGLRPGRQRYGFLTTDAGGISDDLMIHRLGDELTLVVNAASKTADEDYLRAKLPSSIEMTVVPNALIALQGPLAETVLARFAPAVAAMRFMDVCTETFPGAPAIVTRSGYTGEDGFEISLLADQAEDIAEALLAEDGVLPIGLGARDSLRLEAGLCLSGSDIDATTSPVEASLAWAIPAVRRRGGARAGGFPGSERILGEIEHGSSRCRVGLRPQGRAPVRAGAPLFAGEHETAPVGTVTSGGFGPSLQAPVAMGYLPSGLSRSGGLVFAEVRGQRLPLIVTQLPFVPARFKRG